MKTLKKVVLYSVLLLTVMFVPVYGFAAGKINLNTAGVAELTQLSGIGEKTAQKIVEYRTQHKFKSVDELSNVKGIGEKSLAKLRDQVTVEDVKKK